MKIKLVVIGFAFLCGNAIVSGQSSQTFFYDTLVIKDNITNESSEMLSQLRKPITRNFFLKSGETSYALFQGKVASYSADQVLGFLEQGFSLYIDKREHLQHKNLKPSIVEIMDENGEIIETLENLNGIKTSELRRKLVKDAQIRFSGFVISVNEKKYGPIKMDVVVVE